MDGWASSAGVGKRQWAPNRCGCSDNRGMQQVAGSEFHAAAGAPPSKPRLSCFWPRYTGGIGGCHQGLGIVGMRGIHRNPQAGASALDAVSPKSSAVTFLCLMRRDSMLASHVHRLLASVRQPSPPSRQNTLLFCRTVLFHRAGNVDRHLIACGGVAVTVIDDLEIIQVKITSAIGRFQPVSTLDHARSSSVLQTAVVVYPGQRRARPGRSAVGAPGGEFAFKDPQAAARRRTSICCCHTRLSSSFSLLREPLPRRARSAQA